MSTKTSEDWEAFEREWDEATRDRSEDPTQPLPPREKVLNALRDSKTDLSTLDVVQSLRDSQTELKRASGRLVPITGRPSSPFLQAVKVPK